MEGRKRRCVCLLETARHFRAVGWGFLPVGRMHGALGSGASARERAHGRRHERRRVRGAARVRDSPGNETIFFRNNALPLGLLMGEAAESRSTQLHEVYTKAPPAWLGGGIAPRKGKKKKR